MPDSSAPANVPSIDLAAALEPGALMAWLDYQYADHAANNTMLMTRHQKFLTVTEKGISDDVMAGHAADFANELKDEIKATDATRTEIKKPVLHAQRLIDGEAKKLIDRLNDAAASVAGRVTAYLRDKEAKARAAAEAEAARLAAEAEARIAEAQATATIEAGESAVEAIQQAEAAAALAEAKPLELTRTRSSAGSLMGLKDNWTYRVTEIGKVPAAYLTINDAVVKAAIKTGTREIPGLEIYNDTKVSIR